MQMSHSQIWLSVCQVNQLFHYYLILDLVNFGTSIFISHFVIFLYRNTRRFAPKLSWFLQKITSKKYLNCKAPQFPRNTWIVQGPSSQIQLMISPWILSQIISFNNNVVNLVFLLVNVWRKGYDLLGFAYSLNTPLSLWIFQTTLEGTALVHIRSYSIDTPCWLHLWDQILGKSPYTPPLSLYARKLFWQQTDAVRI